MKPITDTAVMKVGICAVVIFGTVFGPGFFTRPVGAEPTLEGIHIVERGIYRAETVRRKDVAKGSMSNTIENFRLIANTTTILAQVGVRFGLRYIALGPPGYSPELKLVNRFPAGGLRDTSTQQISFQSEFVVAVGVGTTNYWEYHFENDWEVVGGLWTFEFWHKDKKLAEQRFCVRDAGTTLKPEFMTGCGPGFFQ